MFFSVKRSLCGNTCVLQKGNAMRRERVARETLCGRAFFSPWFIRFQKRKAFENDINSAKRKKRDFAPVKQVPCVLQLTDSVLRRFNFIVNIVWLNNIILQPHILYFSAKPLTGGASSRELSGGKAVQFNFRAAYSINARH